MTAAYVDKGLSRRQIASELGVAPSTVDYWLRIHDIEMRPSGTARTARAAKDRPAELDDPTWLRARYYDDHMTLEEMAALVSRSPASVRSSMDRHGIPTRTSLLADPVWTAASVGSADAHAVAAVLGVSDSTVYRWLTRHRLPSSGLVMVLTEDAGVLWVAGDAHPIPGRPSQRNIARDGQLDGSRIVDLRRAADADDPWAEAVIATLTAAVASRADCPV